MKTVVPSRLLTLALAADALVSGATAALQVAAPAWLGQLLLLPHALLLETGIFLVAYTVLLIVLARSARVWSGLIGIVVAGNLGWAIGCVALLASGALSPNLLGAAFVATHVIVVLTFATLEFNGLRASTPTSAEGSAGLMPR